MRVFSWEFGSAKKHIDKSCFVSNETGIPKAVRSFFGVEDLGYRESVTISLENCGRRYPAKIENPKRPEQRRKGWCQSYYIAVSGGGRRVRNGASQDRRMILLAA